MSPLRKHGELPGPGEASPPDASAVESGGEGATGGMRRAHPWLLPDPLVLLSSHRQPRGTPQVTLVLESYTRGLRGLLGSLPVRAAGLGSADLNLYQVEQRPLLVFCVGLTFTDPVGRGLWRAKSPCGCSEEPTCFSRTGMKRGWLCGHIETSARYFKK